jgi:hypothetical protein
LTRSRCRARAATSPSVAADVSVHRTVRHSRVNQAISPQTWTIVHVFHDSSPSIRRSGDRLPGPARLSPRSPLNRPNRTAGALKPPPRTLMSGPRAVALRVLNMHGSDAGGPRA